MIWDMCQEWGQDPSWYWSQDRQRRIELLGHRRAQIADRNEEAERQHRQAQRQRRATGGSRRAR